MPGRRDIQAVSVAKIMNGLGIAIVSTPHGVMTDHKARLTNVGGEAQVGINNKSC